MPMSALNYQCFSFKKQALVLFLLLPLLFLSTVVYAADECEDGDLEKCEEEIAKYEERYESTSKQLSSIKDQKESVLGTINNLSNEIYITQSQIDDLTTQIGDMELRLEEIKSVLSARREQLKDKIGLRNRVVRNYYQTGILNTLELFLADTADLSGFQYSAMSYIFNKSLGNESVRLITALNKEISGYEQDKKDSEEIKVELETAHAGVLALQTQLANQKATAETEAAELGEKEKETEEELVELGEKLNDLQQALLSMKGGEFSASLADGVETDDHRTSISYDPGFSPAFAAFSYGAYTHRNGMSQYGAKGRADDGDDYEEILEFYYDTDVKEKDDLDDKTICVDGQGDMELGYYLRGLGEMPPSWDKDALKAQAVAARTYAYRYTKDGGCICTSTNCQYFYEDLLDRSDRERWYEAIEDTENEILDGDVSSQYSSTTGGWINGVGWDTDGGSWPNDAYEKKAGSPWFFKAWFTQYYYKDSSTCGFDHPWLDSEEMADILNAYILVSKGKNNNHVLPETINECGISGFSGDPYSKSELKDKADEHGDAFSEVTGVKGVNYSDGYTSSITFETDRGDYTVDGQIFMKAFNLRAPGYIAIKYTPDDKAIFSIEEK